MDAVFTGLSASLAGMFGKLALDSHSLVDVCKSMRLHPHCHFEPSVRMGMEAFSFLLYVVFNVGLWVCFNRALQSLSTSLEASLIATATNITITACLGQLLFGEGITWWWVSGLFCILLGMFTMAPIKPKCVPLTRRECS